MTARILLAAAALAALSACIDVSGSSGFRCETEAPEVTSTKGDTSVTAIGLKWRETAAGTGTTANACDRVGIYYRAGYLSGTERVAFDSAVSSTPVRFVAGGGQLAVVGVDVGVIGMKQGGKRQIIVPSNLGFGAAEVTYKGLRIPGGSTLVFDVEMVEVTPQDD